VLLTTSAARSIRFPVDEVRVFAGRDSDGIRGIQLGDGDKVIAMAILEGDDATGAERAAYLKQAAKTSPGNDNQDDEPDDDEDSVDDSVVLSMERYAQLGGAEQFILTVTSTGFGKRTSTHRYRRTHRNGVGMVVHNLQLTGGHLVASFPVEDDDALLLVSDQGQIIRVPVSGNDERISKSKRKTKGVRVFRTADDEHVVSVERLEGDGGEPDGDTAEATPENELS
jgi:DNA gyrase subunit A